MSELTGVDPGDGYEERPRWRVRDAGLGDLPEIARMLGELGGVVPARSEIEAATSKVLADPELGRVLVAGTADGGLVGVLAASFQHAIHVPGRYCILQDSGQISPGAARASVRGWATS